MVVKRPRHVEDTELDQVLRETLNSDSDDEAATDPKPDEISDSDEDSEVEHSLAGERGIAVEKFSVSGDIKEGIIDSEGNMLKPEEPVDPWLESMETFAADESLEKAKKMTLLREEYFSSSSSGPEASAEEYLFKLIELLHDPSETPRKAMDRLLGKSAPKAGFKLAIRKRKNEEKSASSNSDVDKRGFDDLTEICDALVAKGLHDVLQEPRAKLQDRLDRVKLEYRWKGKSGEIHGPFSYEQLVAWARQKCFDENPIEIRYSGSNVWRPFIAPG
jgi:hypothetical protein